MQLTPLIIIPARGGSKGIPRKNIRLLAGRPLIAWTIDAALEITDGATDHIIFSTDSEEFADVARASGLPVDYMRPAALATDTAGSREVIIDAMDYADRLGLFYDCVVLLQPTSPMRTADDIRRTMEAYSDDIDMAVTVCEADANPYYNLFETDSETGFLNICKGDGLITRRQEAPKVWEYNGAVYVINPESVRAQALGAFKRRKAVEMPRLRSIDLDTPADWAVAEELMAREHHGR